MNREIIFRGKRVDNGEWVTGDLIHGQGSKYGRMYILPQSHIYPKGCNELDGWDVIPETVGQYTGLKDKNGVEIFEGDVMQITAFHNKGQGETFDFRDLFALCDLKGEYYYDYVTKVIFEDGGFWMSCTSDNDTPVAVLSGDMRHSFPIFECEVLGNVHDNLELVK